nr:uncharacterized protein LOC119713200 [Anas platyrhynchos]
MGTQGSSKERGFGSSLQMLQKPSWCTEPTGCRLTTQPGLMKPRCVPQPLTLPSLQLEGKDLWVLILALPQQLDAIVLPRAFRRSRPLAPPALPSSCCLPPLSGSRLSAGADPQCNILQATGCSRPCCSALSPLAHQRLCKLAKIVMSAICLSSTAPFNQVWPDGRVPSPEPGRGYTTQMQQSGPHGPARVTVSTSELFLARVIRLWFPAAKVVAKLPQLHCLGNIWNTRSLLETQTRRVPNSQFQICRNHLCDATDGARPEESRAEQKAAAAPPGHPQRLLGTLDLQVPRPGSPPPLKLCSLSQPFAHLVPNTQGGAACAGDAQCSFGSKVAQLSPALRRGERTEPCFGSKARRHLASGASPEVWGRTLGARTATARTGQ